MRPAQIAELRQVVVGHDARLHAAVDALERGETIARDDAQRLHDILFLEIAKHVLDANGLTERAVALDDIVRELRDSALAV